MSDDIKLCSKCGTDNIEQHACKPFVVRETYGGEPDGKTYYVAVHEPTGFCFTGRVSRGEAVQDARIANSVLRTESSRLRAELAEANEAVRVLAECIKAVREQRTHEYENGLVPGGAVSSSMEQSCRNIFANPIAAAAVKKAGGGA